MIAGRSQREDSRLLNWAALILAGKFTVLFEPPNALVARFAAAATGALAAMLVVSLLAMPTLSTSGARVPHSHSLFLLTDHDHRVHDNRHDGQANHPGEGDVHADAGTPDSELPRLQEPSSQTSKLRAVPEAATLLSHQQWRRIVVERIHWPLPDGCAESPDPPPPKRAF